jgi:tetratricopeptide (TPR) repeat protein
MVKEKLTRKELLKGPDEFLTVSSRVILYVKEHAKPFKVAGYILAGAALVYLGVNYYLNYANRKGQEAYDAAYYEVIKVKEIKADDEALKKSEDLFKKVITEHGLSKASRLAPPQIAHLKFLEKKYDEAIQLYQAFLKEVPENTVYQSLGLLALAASYEGQGDFGKAVEALQRVLSSSEKSFKEQATLHLARVYGLSKQPDKAIETLKEFIEKYKNSLFPGQGSSQRPFLVKHTFPRQAGRLVSSNVYRLFLVKLMWTPSSMGESSPFNRTESLNKPLCPQALLRGGVLVFA